MKIPVARPTVGAEEIQTAVKVLESGRYVSGSIVEDFEAKFAEYLGVKYGVAVSSGTAALHLALLALGIGPGDEVITAPMSFYATVESIQYVDAIPVFADIDPVTFTITKETVSEVISKRTKCILPVSLFGHPASMFDLGLLARDKKLFLVEDSAQSHGASIRGKKSGSFGDAGVFSFFATKNLCTLEGGFIATNNQGLAEDCRLRRSHGMTDRNTHQVLGYNYRMTELEAAIGLIQLEKLDSSNKRREEIARYYFEKLFDIPGIKMNWPESSIQHAWFWIPIEVNPDEIGMSTLDFRKRLYDRGVETRHRYTEPLYRQPAYMNYMRERGLKPQNGLSVAEKLCGNWLGLPNYPGLTKEQMDYIVKSIKEILKR